MTDYVKTAETEAAAYEKERKKQAATAIEAINKAAEDERRAALADTDAAIRTADRTAWAATDTAAVQQAITLSQARERLANLGLTASGAERAATHAAAVTERRAASAARRTRDEAVTALTEALRRQETAIENERAAEALKQTQTAEQDVLAQRNKLLSEAQRATATEEAARIKAQSKSESVSEYEKNRRLALKIMYEDSQLSSELYARALEEGWTIQQAIASKEPIVRFNRIAVRAYELYENEGFTKMARYLALFELSDNELDTLCHEMSISRSALDKEMNAYRTFLSTSDKAQEIMHLFERGIGNLAANA